MNKILLYLLLFSSFLLSAQVQVTRYDGIGTGSQYLKLTNATKQQILQNNVQDVLVYQGDHGPIVISSVIDPSLVNGTYRLKIVDDNQQTTNAPDQWILEDVNTGDQWTSANTINVFNDQIITGRGFSINIQQVVEPGGLASPNGYIGEKITYANPGNEWLNGVPDDFVTGYFNFIRTALGEVDNNRDPNEVYSDLINKTWYPYPLVKYGAPSSIPSGNFITPAWTNIFSTQVTARTGLHDLNNVNIVLTSDKAKWSRCIVLNTFSHFYENEGIPNPDAPPFSIRTDPSVDKNGDPQSSTGFSWFPGYAIDVESGERLNIFFGENTYFNPTSTGQGTANDLGLSTDNGKDMIWNPSSTRIEAVPPSTTLSGSLAEFPAGGQHFVYVTNELYDECAAIATGLNSSPFLQIQEWEKVIWTTIPILAPGSQLLSMQDGLIPNDVEIQLRVNNPYQEKAGTGMNNGYPLYEFTLDGSALSTEDWTAGAAIGLSNSPLSLMSGESSALTGLPQGTTVTIVATTGQVLRSWKTEGMADYRLLPLELGILSAGQYYIHLQGVDGGSVIRKWVVVD